MHNPGGKKKKKKEEEEEKKIFLNICRGGKNASGS